MPFHQGKFHNKGQAPGGGHSTGSKPPAEDKKQDSGKSQGEPKPDAKSKPMAKGGQPDGEQPKHVTETHPGMTQPHPVTGVHAVHGFHKGGGQYESHTHHDGGDVEVQQHGNAGEMHQHMQQGLPDEGGQDSNQMDMGFEKELSGLNPQQGGGGGGGGY